MVLLRRGRPATLIGSSLEVDMTFDFEPGTGRERHELIAPWRPPIEVFETESELVVRAEIGGLSGNEVEVLVDGDQLVIRGERSVAKPDNHRLYHESRVRYGPFAATVRIPFPADVEAATAIYLDGFLTVALPRLAATRVPARARKVDTLPNEEEGTRR
jgi:HSP20 family molecular chaperone IbpA